MCSSLDKKAEAHEGAPRSADEKILVFEGGRLCLREREVDFSPTTQPLLIKVGLEKGSGQG